MALGLFRLMLISRIVLALVAVSATAVAALTAPASPTHGQEYLQWAPLWLGIPLLAIFAVLETIARSTRGSGRLPIAVGLVAWLAALGSAAVVISHLWLGWSTPAAERDYNYWHLWPLFVWINLIPTVGLPLIVVAILKSVHWYRERRAI